MGKNFKQRGNDEMKMNNIIFLIIGILFLFFGFYINFTIHTSNLEHLIYGYFLTLCNIVGLLFIIGSMGEFTY